MKFLQRLRGDRDHASPVVDAGAADAVADDDSDSSDGPPPEPDAAERAHELDLLRSEQTRLDEFTQRQLRYARYAWEPPAQGGERRADDPEGSPREG